MKGFGLIAVLISLVIVAVLSMKQRNTAVKTIAVPSGQEVKIEEVPAAVQSELDTLNKQSEKRVEEGLNQE